MAIDLPPALPPQLSSPAKVQEYAGGAEATIGNVGSFELRVTGDHGISPAQMDRIFSTAKSPSGAVQLINAQIVRNGRYLVTTFYAPQSRVIYVHAKQGTLTGIEGPEGITHYFDGLKGDPNLTRAEFEKARYMASVKTSRLDQEYAVSYKYDPADPNSVVMTLEEKDTGKEADPADLIFGIGNHGNRFASRYLANVGLENAFSNGTLVELNFETAIESWGESFEDGERYHSGSFKVSHPFSFGILSAEYSELDYDLELLVPNNSAGGVALPIPGVPPIGGGLPAAPSCSAENPGGDEPELVDIQAEIYRMAIAGEHVLRATPKSRWLISERIEHIDSLKFNDDPNCEGGDQDEEYSTVELATSYHRSATLGGKPFGWHVAGIVEVGIGDDDGTFESVDPAVAANGGVPAFSPQYRTAEFTLIKPALGFNWSLSEKWSWSGDFVGQFTEDRLPEQQQWVLGGADTISAYLPGVLVGDTGYYAKSALNRKFGSDSNRWVLSGFVEYGTAYYEDYNSSQLDAPVEDLEIGDAGIRLSGRIGDVFTVDFVAAESFMDEGYENEDTGEEILLDNYEAEFIMRMNFRF